MKKSFVMFAAMLAALITVSFASAQTMLAQGPAVGYASAALKLPVTDRIVFDLCYLKDVRGGYQRLRKEDFSQSAQGEMDAVTAEFGKVMVEKGFKEVSRSECSKDDDPAGGIVVRLIFDVAVRTFGKDSVGINLFLKVPKENKFLKVDLGDPKKNIIGIENVVSLSEEMMAKIKEAQKAVN